MTEESIFPLGPVVQTVPERLTFLALRTTINQLERVRSELRVTDFTWIENDYSRFTEAFHDLRRIYAHLEERARLVESRASKNEASS